MSDFDPYRVLKVRRNASAETIKKAYRRLSLKLHPDRGGDADSFAELNRANAILSDPEKRAQYDRDGRTDFVECHQYARSAQILASELRGVLQDLVSKGRNPSACNLIEIIRGLLRKKKYSVQEKLSGLKKSSEVFSDVEGRFAAQEGVENFLGATVQQVVSQITEQIRLNQEAIAEVDDALELLKRFSFNQIKELADNWSAYSTGAPNFNWTKLS